MWFNVLHLNTTHVYTQQTRGIVARITPLIPHDALKHNFTFMETHLIFLQPRVLGQENSWNIFFHLPPASTHLHPLQVENCESNSRLVVNGDDNDKSVVGENLNKIS